jgi:hypothetical protein
MLPALYNMLLKRYIFAELHYRTFCHFYCTSTAIFGKITGAVPHLFARKTAPKHSPWLVYVT